MQCKLQEDIIEPINEQNNDLEILGKVYYKKWPKKYNFFFKLDFEKGNLLCYKNLDSLKQCAWYDFKKGYFNDEQFNDKNFIYVKSKKGKQFKIEILEKFKQPDVRAMIYKCFFTIPSQKSNKYRAVLGKGMISVLKLPFSIISGILFTAEKIGDGARDPSSLLKPKIQRKEITNPVSGLILGSTSMIRSVIAAVVGLIKEPVQGYKSGGIKGATVGVGKGLFGIIFKPVAGSIDVITMAARGSMNMPNHVYKNIFKLVNKNKKQDVEELKLGSFEIIAEDGSQILYLNKESNLQFDQDMIEKLKKIKKLKSESHFEATNLEPEGEDLNQLLEFYQKQNEIPDENDEDYEFLVLQYQSNLNSDLKSSINSLTPTNTFGRSIREFKTQVSPFMSTLEDDLISQVIDYDQQSIGDQIEVEDSEENIYGAPLVEGQGEMVMGTIKPLQKMQFSTFENTQKIINKWQPLVCIDEVRHPQQIDVSGRKLDDPEIAKKSRNCVKQIISEVARKVMTGSLDLSSVTCPISVMVPQSMMDVLCFYTNQFPLLVTKAAQISDPLERFKMYVVACLSAYIGINIFAKPLNPIIGETLNATYGDGSKIYAEQISHHPPISYMYLTGPNDLYTYNAYFQLKANAGLNGVRNINKGKRKIIFKDGQTIDGGFPEEHFAGLFMGAIKHDTMGKQKFEDIQNNLSIEIEYGAQKNRPTDYIFADLMQNGKKISTLHGSAYGYFNYDNIRYFDYRTSFPFKYEYVNENLKSDCTQRPDRLLMLKGYIVDAEQEKLKLELTQRNDNKLRKNHKK